MRRGLQVVAVIWAFIIIFDVRITQALKAQYGESHIYEFSSEISTGVEEPAQFISKFAINGLMKIQRNTNDPKRKNVYFISLENVQHSSYYGPITSTTVEGNKFEPIQRDSQDLEKPFLAIYDEHGKIQGLKIQNGEKSWTKSIKKSIASLLQFDWSKTLNLIQESTGDNVFTVESTVHGKCSVLYNATQQNKVPGKIGRRAKLTKTYNPNECSNSIHSIEGYGVQYKYPLKTIKDQMSSNVNTILEFDIMNDGPIIKKIFNREKYIWALDGLGTINYNSNSFQHTKPKFVEISHILTFNKTDKSSDFNKLGETMFSKINSQLVLENEEIVEDYPEVDVERTIEEIKNLFTEAVEYLKTNRLENMKFGEEPRQLYNKIQSALRRLNIEQLEHLYDGIVGIDEPETNLIRDTLIQIIPFAGTKASFVFTKNLIMTGKIVDDYALRVLDQMPAYIRQPTKELLLEMRALIDKNNGLPIDVFKKAILSYSNLLRRISTRQNGSEELMKENLKYFNDSLEDAESIGMKLVYLTALANTGSHDAVEYLLPLLKKEQGPSMERLRYGVVRLLAPLVDEDDSVVFELLERILLDESEPRHVRLAAYDVLVARAELDEDDAGDIDRAMAGDEHLRNYHQSTLQMLKQLNVLPESWKRYASGHFETSTLLSFNAIVKIPEASRVFELAFGKASHTGLVKISVVMQEGLPVVSCVVVDISSGRLVELVGDYMNLHLTDDIETKNERFFDLWVIKVDRITFNHVDVSSLNLNDSSPLDLLIKLKKAMSRIVMFTYRRLTSFSMRTGFGIPIVFQHKSPYFLSSNCDFKMKMDGTKFAINLNISLDVSEQAYSDSLFYNPITKLMHSIKRYDITEMHVPFSLSVNYDFLGKTLKVELPIILKNQNSNRGLMSYTSSGVMITQDDDKTNSCPFCGFQQVKLKDLNRYFNSNDVQEYNTVGLKITTSVYDCQSRELPITRLLHKQFLDVKSLKVDQCGITIIIGPDTLGSVSQIELMMRADVHSSESKEKPWYFLPGSELHFKSALALRKHFDNSIVKIGSYNLDFVSSQGHFTNELNFTLSAKTHRSDYLNACYNMRQSYPEVLDTRLPSLDDTRNLRTNTIHRVTFGYSFNDNCSDNLASFKLEHPGRMTSKQIEDLKQRALDSNCAKQKSNPQIVYPLGSSPLTIDCIDEFISNSTLRNYVFNLTYDKISDYPIVFVIKHVHTLAELLKANYPGVEIKMISPLTEAFQGNVVYEMNFPVIDTKTKSLGNIYLDNTFFSYDFIKKVKNGKISVTNVFPELMISSSGMSKQLTNLNDWKRIRSNIEDCKILIKSVESDLLSVKIVCGDNELRFEPTRITRNTKKELTEDVSFEPAVYFNDNLVGHSPERVFLPLREANREDDHIFSLLKVEPYIMGRPMMMPLSVYYSINSITVMEEN